jgi:predicted dehydrogenase
MEGSVIRYGIVGCGRHAFQGHAVPGMRVEGLELAGICDTDQEALEGFAERYRLPIMQTTTSFDELLANSDLQAIVICTPDAEHMDQLKLAVEAKKHVLVEKPLATEYSLSRMADLGAIFKSAENSKLVLTSCHPRRFSQPYRFLKNEMGGYIAKFGEPLCFTFDYSAQAPAKVKQPSLILDHLSHDIDIMNYLLGYSDVSAAAVCVDQVDRYLVNGTRESDGVSFVFHATKRLHKGDPREQLEIRFERCSVRLNVGAGWLRVGPHDEFLEDTRMSGQDSRPSRALGVMQNFADAIRGREECYLTRQDIWLNCRFPLELLEFGRLPR